MKQLTQEFIDTLIEWAFELGWGDDDESTSHPIVFGNIGMARGEYIQSLLNAHVDKVTDGSSAFNNLAEAINFTGEAARSALIEMKFHPEDFTVKDAMFILAMAICKSNDLLHQSDSEENPLAKLAGLKQLLDQMRGAEDNLDEGFIRN